MKYLKPLAFAKIVLSLFFETLLPYLKTAVVALIPKLKEQGKLKLAKMLQLIVHLSEVWLFVYQLRYLVDPKFQFFKPYLAWLGILIRRQNEFESQASQTSKSSSWLSKLRAVS